MNTVVESIIRRAREDDKHIVLPERRRPARPEGGRQNRPRRTTPASRCSESRDVIARNAAACGASLDGVEILDHLKSPQRDEFIATLFEARKAKGMTEDKAAGVIDQNVYFGAYYVGAGLADGMVAGSISCPTADTCRATLYGVGLCEGNRTLSACKRHEHDRRGDRRRRQRDLRRHRRAARADGRPVGRYRHSCRRQLSRPARRGTQRRHAQLLDEGLGPQPGRPEGHRRDEPDQAASAGPERRRRTPARRGGHPVDRREEVPRQRGGGQRPTRSSSRI